MMQITAIRARNASQNPGIVPPWLSPTPVVPKPTQVGQQPIPIEPSPDVPRIMGGPTIPIADEPDVPRIL